MVRLISDTATEFEFNGLNYSVYNVLGADIDPSNTLDAVSLKRYIQGDVKVRPTNVTAVAYIVVFDAASDPNDPDVGIIVDSVVEVILLQNGPKGGFSQLGLEMPTSTQTGDIGTAGTTRLFVNEVVDAVITSE